MIFDISSTNNKVFRERIWIDISKICKKFIDLLYLSKISKEREKRGKDTERLMRDRRTVSKSKTVFPGSWWSEAFRGEFFRLPDATQVKRGILVSTLSLVPSLCGQKKKPENSCHRHCRTRASSTDRNFPRGEGNIWSLKLIFWQPREDSYFGGRDRGDFASKRTDRAASSSINWVSTPPPLSVEYYIFEGKFSDRSSFLEEFQFFSGWKWSIKVRISSNEESIMLPLYFSILLELYNHYILIRFSKINNAFIVLNWFFQSIRYFTINSYNPLSLFLFTFAYTNQ